MPEKYERKRTLKSYAILGSAAFINMLLSLVRVKVLAVLLGPAGVGLMGFLINLMTTSSQLMGMGVGSSGTKQIGECVGRQDATRLNSVRRALFWGTMSLGVAGGGIVFLLKDLIADIVFVDSAMAAPVGWLALGVALSISASAQSALITGMRKISVIAKVQITAGFLSTLIGLTFIWFLGIDGLIYHVLAAPLSAFLVGHFYVLRLPRVNQSASSLIAIVKEWRWLASIGFSMMFAELVISFSILVVRGLVQREAGPVELGYFQAALGLSMMYLGFVLAVLGTDFYPKLAGIYHDKKKSNELVNEQTRSALLISAPFMFLLMGALPWAIPILYSEEFLPSIDILRWIIIADAIKVITIPLRFVVIVGGSGRIIVMTEIIGAFFFVGATWVLLPVVGVEATGMAYLARYLVFLPLLYFLARALSGLSWIKGVKYLAFSLISFLVVLALISSYSKWVGALSSFIVIIMISPFLYSHFYKKS